MRRAALFLLLSAMLGCESADTASSPDVPAWDPAVESPPLWLSETGLFTDLPSMTPRPDALPYAPPHTLWSNGAAKHRFLWLPDGETIIPTDGDDWAFPVGTVAVKSFTFDYIEGRSQKVPVETRLIIRDTEGWQYAVYHWNQQGTEARLLLDNWDEVPLELGALAGNTFSYSIPARLDCRGCHETQPQVPIIGISRHNLAPELTAAFSTSPILAPFPARSETEAAVMGYLVGNCVHCHHGVKGSVNASFSLLPEDLVANTVGVATDSSASGVGVRIVPGDVTGSALYEAVVEAGLAEYPGDFKPMPPVGIVWTDPDVAALLARWIESL